MENYTEINQNFSNIDEVISLIKHDTSWLSGELGFNVVHHDSDRNVMVVAMHTDSEFESFQANSALIIKVIGGNIRLRIKGNTSVIPAGKSVILREHSFYLIESLDEAVFLLTTYNSPRSEKINWLC